MKKSHSDHSKDSELMHCVNSAYNDLQILLKDAFSNVGQLPNQLTFNEFYSLFERYDWQDVFNILEEIENLPNLAHIESVYSSLNEFLFSYQTPLLSNPRENTYYKVWAGIITEGNL